MNVDFFCLINLIVFAVLNLCRSCVFQKSVKFDFIIIFGTYKGYKVFSILKLDIKNGKNSKVWNGDKFMSSSVVGKNVRNIINTKLKLKIKSKSCCGPLFWKIIDNKQPIKSVIDPLFGYNNKKKVKPRNKFSKKLINKNMSFSEVTKSTIKYSVYSKFHGMITNVVLIFDANEVGKSKILLNGQLYSPTHASNVCKHFFFDFKNKSKCVKKPSRITTPGWNFWILKNEKRVIAWLRNQKIGIVKTNKIKKHIIDFCLDKKFSCFTVEFSHCLFISVLA